MDVAAKTSQQKHESTGTDQLQRKVISMSLYGDDPRYTIGITAIRALAIFTKNLS